MGASSLTFKKKFIKIIIVRKYNSHLNLFPLKKVIIRVYINSHN